MIARGEAWRRGAKVWLPALAFFALNVSLLVFYRLNYAGESAGLERRRVESESQLATVEAARAKAEELVERARVNRGLVDEVYRDRFSTQRQRLTRIIEEVKSLARKAGLAPQAIAYPAEDIADFAVIERSFEFTVQGTYPQLMTFVNFLELSPSFLTLKQVELTGGDARDSGLRISLTLSTLFSQEGEGEAAPEAAR
jgi:Tfp pilus assembly protein PilO